MTPNPTAAQLKTRYPEFTPVADLTVDAIIAEVSPMVDDGWFEADRVPGVLALAAHQLFTEGYPARSGEGGGTIDPTGRVVLGRKVGDVQVTYGRTDAQRSEGGSSLSTYSTSVYGKTWLRLLKLNVPAVGLV